MNEKVEAVIANIKECSFVTDRKENVEKSQKLLDAKVSIKQKLFDLDAEYDKARNELLMKEEIQKGKNAEVRNAMMELELVGRFDKREEYRLIIAIIGNVEKHNDNIISMFFNGKGE